MGALIVVGDGPEVSGDLLGRTAARRRVQPRNGCPSWPRWTAPSSWPPTPAASPGQRPPGPEPQRPDQRDRHPAPHGRAGGALDRRSGDRGVGGHVGHHALPGRHQACPGLSGPTAGPGQSGPADAGALPGPPRRGDQLAVRPRGRGSGHGAGCRDRAAAGRDGAPYRRGDRGIHRRARHRRPVGPLQLEELLAGVEDERRHVVRRLPARRRCSTGRTRSWLALGHAGDGAAACPPRRWRPCSSCEPGVDLEIRACSLAATGCCRGFPAWPSRSSSTWSLASATCRRCCAPRSTSSRPSASVDAGHRPAGQGRTGPPGRIQHPRPLQLTAPSGSPDCDRGPGRGCSLRVEPAGRPAGCRSTGPAVRAGPVARCGSAGRAARSSPGGRTRRSTC